jgi:hypothetical protein
VVQWSKNKRESANIASTLNFPTVREYWEIIYYQAFKNIFPSKAKIWKIILGIIINIWMKYLNMSGNELIITTNGFIHQTHMRH